ASPGSPTVADQPGRATGTSTPAGTTIDTIPASPTGTAVTEQSCRAAATAGLTWCTVSAGPTIAVQDAAGSTVTPRRRGIGAVADQRSPELRVGARVDLVEQILPDVGDLGGRIRARGRVEDAHKVSMKRRRLHAHRLICLCVGAEQRRDRRRYL